MTGQQKDNQDSRHMQARPQDLSIPLFHAEMRTDAKKENSRAHGIDDRDKRYQRNAHPGKKFT
jgi:hypothetical protein